MKFYSRRLNLADHLKKKSHFLFGPRSTGKSSLIKNQLPEALVFDLLDRAVFNELLKNPSILRERIKGKKQVVVIDEIQKLPSLLDEVHRLIFEKEIKFLLTGSSARKLKRGGVNLLGGRAWEAQLFPLSFIEIEDFNLIRYLNRGGLPHIYQSSHAGEELRSYVHLYLQEEIHAEALTRNLEAFTRFLDVVAISNGEEISYVNLANDSGIQAKTIQNYTQILFDTLLAYSLKPFLATKKRKAITREKIYLFDLGVVNQLANRGEIKNKSELFGKAFEHFLMNEVRAYLSYHRIPETMHYWRSTSQFEVDLVVGTKLAVEFKATDSVDERHLRGLKALQEEGLVKRFIVVSQDRNARKHASGIEILPWSEFLNRLWAGTLIR
ncbi:MAG: ATP-binding protein [Pseudomonadota bacterium]